MTRRTLALAGTLLLGACASTQPPEGRAETAHEAASSGSETASTPPSDDDRIAAHDEAAENLPRIASAIANDYAGEHWDPGASEPRPSTFPPALAPTPAEPSSVPAPWPDDCDPRWQALDAVPEEPVGCSYAYAPDADGQGFSVTARCIGGSFEVRGRLEPTDDGESQLVIAPMSQAGVIRILTEPSVRCWSMVVLSACHLNRSS